MVVGKLLFETAKFAVQRTKESYDLLYAVGSGTAIGIASGETVRGSYELWKGTNRSNEKARQQRWYNRSLRRRFKGDVLVEADNTVQETHIPDQPGYNRSSGYKQFFPRSGYRSRKYTTTTGRSRCNCKGMLHRILGKPRFRKRNRLLHRYRRKSYR